MKSTVFWNVTPCRLAGHYAPEGSTFHSHHCENLRSNTVGKMISFSLLQGPARVISEVYTMVPACDSLQVCVSIACVIAL
jgi:hypothetical protein